MFESLALGPMVRVAKIEESWHGSILVASCREPSPLKILDLTFHPEKLDRVGDLDFWRFAVTLPRGESLAVWRFQIQGRAGSIPVPGIEDKARFAFASCIGFQEEETAVKMGGLGKLPGHLARHQEKRPYHAILLGGDQLYCDGVFKLTSLQKWLASRDEATRAKTPFTKKMRDEVTAYYLQHYIAHFSNPDLAKMLAHLPFHATWDDHDIFDGWGSYDRFHKTKIAQEIFKIAKRMYLLVQQHTTEIRARPDGLIGQNGFSSILPLSDAVTAVFVDSRTTRCKDVILPEDEWNLLFANLEAALQAKPVRFLFIVFAVPLIYPEFGRIEDILDKLNKYDWTRAQIWEHLFGKHLLNNYTHEYELLDDMVDHPKSKYHRAERDAFFLRLFALARAYNVRICFGGGDVHAMGYGESRSREETAPERDPCFIPQFISSAMGNEPILEVPLKVLRALGKGEEESTSESVESMVKIAPKGKLKPKSLFANRGYMTFEVDGRGLKAVWHLEEDRNDRKSPLATAKKRIPPLQIGDQGGSDRA